MHIRNNPFVKTAVFLLPSIFIFCGTALAQLDNPDLPNRTGYKIGDVYLHSAGRVEEQLETNVFLANTDRKADAITVLSPSVGIEIPLRDNRISADYEAGIFMYAINNSENHIDHRARGLVEIKLTDYKIEIRDTFRDYTDRAADENSRRLGRDVNDFEVALSGEFDKLSFEVAYNNIMDWYGSVDDEMYQTITYGDRDRFANIVDGIISYRIMPKTSIFAQGELGFIHYYNSSIPPDSYFISGCLGLKGRPTNKILVNIRGGLKFQRYDTSDMFHDKDYVGLIAAGGFDYFMTKDDTITFSVVKDSYESLYSNMNYYDRGLIELRYSHQFNDKVKVAAWGAYELSMYPSTTTENGETAKRYDNIYSLGCLGRYDIRKWLSAQLKYEYILKDSRFDVFNYVDNKVTVSGTAGF